jgi:hypothetical protein
LNIGFFVAAGTPDKPARTNSSSLSVASSSFPALKSSGIYFNDTSNVPRLFLKTPPESSAMLFISSAGRSTTRESGMFCSGTTTAPMKSSLPYFPSSSNTRIHRHCSSVDRTSSSNDFSHLGLRAVPYERTSGWS